MLTRSAAMPAFIILAACSGGGGGGASAPVAASPTPTPSPTASPSPTPSPTPAVAAASGTAVGIGPMLGIMFWNFAQRQFDLATGTDLQGRFGPNVTPYAEMSAGRDAIPGRPPIEGNGIDAATGLPISLSAPYGASVVSPISTLIHRVGDEAKVRRFLGLAGSDDDAIDLLNFNPTARLGDSNPGVARNAARLMALNVRILALQRAVLENYFQDPWVPIVETIKAESAPSLVDIGFARTVFRYHPANVLAPDYEAILVDTYQKFASIIPAEIDSVDTARSYMLLLAFYVRPTAFQNGRGASPAELDVIRNYTAADMRAWLAIVATTPRTVPDSALILAAPDFREIYAGGNPVIANPLENDPLPFVTGVAPKIEAVSLDPAQAANIEVSITPDGITVKPKTRNWKGFAYFDYRIRYLDRSWTSRVYVRLGGVDL